MQTPQHVQDLNREDLIILGLEWTVNDAELKRYFEQFGEVAAAEVCVCVCVSHIWHEYLLHVCVMMYVCTRACVGMSALHPTHPFSGEEGH